NNGYSLFELVIVIIIIGIIASISVTSLKNSVEVSRVEETKIELDQLAYAISGNPELISGGTRNDFGYVGDIGSLPSNLTALVTNPGYSTWNGPYVRDDFYASTGASETEFTIDAWGVTYTYTGGVIISSTGSGSTITREIANSTGELLYNSVSAVITDIDNFPPGTTYKDSITVQLSYPDGAGSIASITKYPGVDGFVQFDSIPIGIHNLQVVYLPNNDSLNRTVTVNQGSNFYANISLYKTYSGSGSTAPDLQFLPGSMKTTGGGCNKLEFKIINMSENNINVNSITLTWSTPTAYYKMVNFSGGVFNQNNPRAGSGDIASFSSTKTVNSGQTITVKVEDFEDVLTGGGNNVDMSNTTITITFSDGSTFDINTGVCI
ncbi:MAG: prepilin-type N-terminal cleavage/methylation domain-containing protein, partial [Candidatus Zixiibacteriota bacterium]